MKRLPDIVAVLTLLAFAGCACVAAEPKARTLLKGRDPVNYLCFSPDGKILESGTSPGDDQQWGEVKLWDVATGKEIGPPKRLDNLIGFIGFTADGKTLACADVWGTLRLAALGRYGKCNDPYI